MVAEKTSSLLRTLPHTSPEHGAEAAPPASAERFPLRANSDDPHRDRGSFHESPPEEFDLTAFWDHDIICPRF